MDILPAMEHKNELQLKNRAHPARSEMNCGVLVGGLFGGTNANHILTCPTT